MFEIGQRVIAKDPSFAEQFGIFGTVCGIEVRSWDDGVECIVSAERLDKHGRYHGFSGPANAITLLYDQPQPILELGTPDAT